MSIDKNVLTASLKGQRSELLAIIGHLSYPLCESSRLTDIAEYELGLAVKRLRNRLNAIDAELDTRRGMGLGTAPLSELTEAPTAMAS